MLSISPENEASLRIAANLGFQQIAQCEDESDGMEYIFRLDQAAGNGDPHSPGEMLES